MVERKRQTFEAIQIFLAYASFDQRELSLHESLPGGILTRRPGNVPSSSGMWTR